MKEGNQVFFDVADPVWAVIAPYAFHLLPRIDDKLLIPLESRFEAKMVSKLCPLEFLKAEQGVQNQEESLLHLKLNQHKRKVPLQDLQNEEYHPKQTEK